MKLTDYFPSFSATAETQPPVGGKQKSAENQNGGGFDQILNAVEQREENRYKPKEAESVKPKEKPPEKPANENTDENTGDQVAAKDAPEKEQKAEKTQKKPEVNQDGATAKTETEEKALEEVAEVLEITPEALAQILAGLNMTVADLAEPANVTKLLQVVLDAPSPAALLTMPQFAEMFKKVNEVMAGFAPVLEEAAALETAQPQTAERSQALENAQVSVDENGETQVTFKAEQTATQTAGAKTGTEAADADAALDTDGETKPAEAVPRTQTASQQNNMGGSNPQSGNQLLNQNGNAAAAETAGEQEIAVSAATNNTQQTAQTAATQTVRAAAATVADANDVMDQIMNRIRTAGNSFTEVRMTLRPENLGDIALRVSTQNGIVTAQFVAESQRIKEIIEANFNQLRDVLNEQGINFSALNVSVRQDSQNERMAQFEQGRQSSRARIESITEAEVETDEAEQEELMQGNVNIRV